MVVRRHFGIMLHEQCSLLTRQSLLYDGKFDCSRILRTTQQNDFETAFSHSVPPTYNTNTICALKMRLIRD